MARRRAGGGGAAGGSYKTHADLQIEKVREKEKEDSPLTKPCTDRILHHPSNERKKKKEHVQHHWERD